MIRRYFFSGLRFGWPLAFIAVLSLLVQVSVEAQTWDGGGTAGGILDWSTATNWNPDVAPANNGTANIIFAGTIDTNPGPNLDQNWNVNSVTFNSGAGAFVLGSTGGFTLTVQGGGISVNNASGTTINHALALGAPQTWFVNAGLIINGAVNNGGNLLTVQANSGGPPDINGVISGSGGLTLTGSASQGMTLDGTAANTYTGTTTVNAGVLTLFKTAGVTAIPGNVIVGDGTGTDTLAFAALKPNQIADTASVTINSSGVFNLNSSSDTIGAFTVNGGTVTLGTGTLTVASLQMTAGSISGTGAGTLVLGGNVTTNASAASASVQGGLNLGGVNRNLTVADGAATNDLDISANISNGGITKLGAGTMQLSGNNTFTGGVTINAGTLLLGNTGALNSIAPNSVTFGPGSTGMLTLNGNSVAVSGLNTNATAGTPVVQNASGPSATLMVTNAVTNEFDGVLQDGGGGALNLTKTGAGTLILGGNNLYTGTTIVNAGTLRVTNPNALGSTVNLTTVANGASLDILASVGAEPVSIQGTGVGGAGALTGNAASLAGAVTLTGDTTIGVPSGPSFSLLGTVSGNFALTKVDVGTLNLNGNNTFTGGLIINAGNVTLGNAGALNSTTPKSVTFGAGSAESLTLNGNSVAISGLNANAGGNPLIQNISFTPVTLTVNTVGSDTYNGVLQDGGGAASLSLSKDGTGVLGLGGTSSNTYTGTTKVNGGVLALNKTASAIAITGPLVIGIGDNATPATVQLLGQSNQISALSDVTINNPGLLDLANFNDAVGLLTFNGGTVNTGNGTISSAGNVQANANSATATVNGNFSLTGTQTFLINDGSAATDFSINGVVSGGLGLVKTGAGTMVLAGSSANTYSGPTTVNGGRLILNKSAGIAIPGPLAIGIGDSTPAIVQLTSSSGQISSSSNVTLNGSGAILDLNGFNDTISSLTISGGGTAQTGAGAFSFNAPIAVISNASNFTATISGNINLLSEQIFQVADGSAAVDLDVPATIVGGGIVDKTGFGVMRLSGANTFSGGLSTYVGTVLFANNSAAGSGALTFFGGNVQADGAARTIANAAFLSGNFGVTGSLDLTFTGLGTLTSNSAVQDDNSGVTTFSSPIGESGGSRSLTKNGPGTLRLSGANAFTGGLIVNSGTVLLGNNQSAGTGVLTINGGTIVADGSPRTLANSVVLNTMLGIYFPLELSFTGPISGSGGIDKDFSAPLRLAGMNTFSGGLNMFGGTLIVANDSATGTGPLLLANGTIQIEGANRTLNNSAVTLASDMTFSGFDLTFSGPATLTGNRTLTINNANTTFLGGIGQDVAGRKLTKTGAGTLNLAGNSTFTGALTINQGTVVQSGNLVASVTNKAVFTYNGGTFAGTLTNLGTFNINADFTAGSGIENDTTINIASSATLTANGTGLLNVGIVTLDNGDIEGSAPFLNDFGGTFSGRGTIGAAVTNNGAITLTGVLNFGQGGTNFGSIAIATNQSLRPGSTLTNSGSIALAGGGIGGAGSISNSNAGTIQGFGGITVPLTNNGGIIKTTANNTLVLSNFSGGNINGGQLEIADNSQLTVPAVFASAGTILLDGTNAILAGGTLTNTGTISGLGRISNTLTNSGIIRAEAGQLTLSGASPTNGAGGQIQAATGATVFYTQGLATNAGVIALTGGTFDNDDRVMTNSSSINGFGTLRTGSLTSTSLLSIGGGNMDVFGNVTNNGTVNVQAARTLYFHNNVNGSGNYTGTGTVVYLGSFSPGNSPASISFAGSVDLTGSSSLVMELGGLAVGTQYDQVGVAGQLALSGTLLVSLINNFAPSSGQSFDILDWGSLTGSFSSLQLPTLSGGLAWNTSRLYTSGVLSVSPALLGDYNANGVVDAADYVVWRRALGTSTNLAADGNNSGAIDPGDFDIWRAQFGQTAGSGAGASASAAVPEPATLLMAIAGILTMIARRHTFVP